MPGAIVKEGKDRTALIALDPLSFYTSDRELGMMAEKPQENYNFFLLFPSFN